LCAVLRGAQHADVLHRGRPTASEGLFVMQLKQGTLSAALAVGADEGAAGAVAGQDLAPDLVRDVASVQLGHGLIAADAGPLRGGEASLHAFGDQQVEAPSAATS
jgi:hypothetical protein